MLFSIYAISLLHWHALVLKLQVFVLIDKNELHSLILASLLVPVGYNVFVGNTNGTVLAIDTRQIKEGEYSFQLLPSGHRVGNRVEHLLALDGTLNPEGFLSVLGDSVVVTKDRRLSVNHLKGIDSIPSTVLVSIGIGYQETFTQHTCTQANTHNGTYFVTWALPLYDNQLAKHLQPLHVIQQCNLLFV